MTRKDFLRCSAGGTLTLASASLLSAGRTSGPAPNILFVFPDQMRGQAMGFLGEEPVLTPFLDRLAGESIVLTEAASNYPVCSPYRAMLMTGRYPHANRVLSNCNSRTTPFNCELQTSDRCWSDVLKDKGYSLGYIGKWHLDSPREPYIDCANNRGSLSWNEWCRPDRRHGFDFWYAYGTYDLHLNPMYWSTEAGRDDFKYVGEWGPEHEADLAIEYLRNTGGEYRDPGKPFALVVSMNPPHTPYSQVPQRYVDRYDSLTDGQLCKRPNIPPAETGMGKYYRKNIRNYYAMVTGVDEQLGRILEALEREGLKDDTIVVFTSDHGNCLGIHGRKSKNNRYEESMRIPMLIRYPGHIEPRRDDLLISSMDLYPTLLELAGFAEDIPAQVDGESRAELLLTGQGTRPRNQWYMWCNPQYPALGRRGLRTHRYTFVISRSKDGPEEAFLHDRREDPYQLKNIAGEMPGLVREFTAELNARLESYNDPWVATSDGA